MSAALDRIRAALESHGCRVVRSGDGLAAQCPAHDDRAPSLSLGEGADGRALLHCHAGCDTTAILEALGLLARDLYAAPRSVPPSEIVYTYTTLAGAVAFQVVRRPGKKFLQRRPDGRGGWSWSLKGLDPELRSLPYKLPDIAKAAGKFDGTVFVVEGERDVESLWRAGWPATCNAGGAGKWTNTHTNHLVAAGVRKAVVVADRDEPGRQHARQVAASLRALGVEVLSVVESHCACGCKDAADLLATHGDDPEGWPIHDLQTEDDRRAASEEGSEAGAVECSLPDLAMPPLDQLGLLGQFAEVVARSVQVTPEFALATALAVLAVPCGLGLTVEVRPGWREPALLQMFVVADPGERKTQVLAPMVDGLYRAECELRERRDQERQDAEAEAEVLQKHVERARKAGDDSALRAAIKAQKAHRIPAPFRVLTQSGTAEALEKLAGEQDGCIALVTDEGGEVFGDIARYHDVANLRPLLAGYDAGRYAVERVKRAPVVLNEIRVPIAAMVQPVVLATLRADALAVGRGLLQRFSVVVPGSLVGHRQGFGEPLDPVVAEAWGALLYGLMLEAFTSPAVATLDVKARDLLEAHHDRLEGRFLDEFDAPVLRGWAAKHVGRTARLAGILLAMRTGRLGGVVDGPTMSLAIELAEWLAAHALRALQVGGDPAEPSTSRTQRMAFALVEAVAKAKGRLPREDAPAALAAAGFGNVPERTVQRAVKRAGLRLERTGFQGGYDLVMPADCESASAGGGELGELGELGLTSGNADDEGESGELGDRASPGHANLAKLANLAIDFGPTLHEPAPEPSEGPVEKSGEPEPDPPDPAAGRDDEDPAGDWEDLEARSEGWLFTPSSSAFDSLVYLKY